MTLDEPLWQPCCCGQFWMAIGWIKYFIEGGINCYYKDYKCLQCQCYQHSIITLVYSSMGGVPSDGNREWFRRSCSEYMAALISKQSLQVQFRCSRRQSYCSACWETVTRWSIVNIVSDRQPSFKSQCQDTWHGCGVDDLWPPDKVMMTVPIGGCTAFNLPS